VLLQVSGELRALRQTLQARGGEGGGESGGARGPSTPPEAG